MKTILSIFLIISIFYAQAQSDIYDVLKNNNEHDIEKMISKIETNKSSSLQNAYLGALYMKKADHLKDVKLKIATFKKGNQLLENEIDNNNDNIEFRFLRLAIQENAPKILKYNGNLDEDSKIITKQLNTLNSALQIIIKEYSKGSLNLNL